MLVTSLLAPLSERRQQQYAQYEQYVQYAQYQHEQEHDHALLLQRLSAVPAPQIRVVLLRVQMCY
jgi:hypothetical protein